MVGVNYQGVQLLQQGASRRRTRSPSHQFYVKNRPWQIQPFMIAPVLPGETLKNAVFQSRVVTDPIKNPLIGWWSEHYIFYVKLRDLYSRDLMRDMLLSPGADLSSLDGSTDVKYYHGNSASTCINWPLLCTTRIVDEYFRNEGEVAGDYTIDGLFASSVNIQNALDSAMLSLDTDTSVDQNLVSTSAGQGDGTTAVWTSEIRKAMESYLFSLQNKTTDMTFEDWCRQFGVKMPEEELLRPELVRYSRDWSYPSNTIDPADGSPVSAVSWSIAGRADKDRYFREPGFLVGLTCTRPKVYFNAMRSHMTMLMRDAYSWLPAPLAQDPLTSFVKVPSGEYPLSDSSSAYTLDIKDLLLYGDQFVNVSLAATVDSVSDTLNNVGLPNAGLTNVRYPSLTDAELLFVDDAAPGTLQYVKQDGICTLHILGRQVDTSPNSVGTNRTV